MTSLVPGAISKPHIGDQNLGSARSDQSECAINGTPVADYDDVVHLLKALDQHLTTPVIAFKDDHANRIQGSIRPLLESVRNNSSTHGAHDHRYRTWPTGPNVTRGQ